MTDQALGPYRRGCSFSPAACRTEVSNETHRFKGEEPDCDTGLFTEFGFATDLRGDLNGDGLADPLIGAIFAGSRCKFRPGSVDAFAGNDLFLNATPRKPQAGGALALRIAEGPSGHPTLLFLVDFNGVPLFVEVGGMQPFGPDETRTVAGIIPAGLADSTLEFKAFARGAGGVLVDSAVETVSVRRPLEPRRHDPLQPFDSGALCRNACSAGPRLAGTVPSRPVPATSLCRHVGCSGRVHGRQQSNNTNNTNNNRGVIQ